MSQKIKVAYLTRIKDEEELIYFNLLYYKNLGVDCFFITFNNSNQETIDEVERFFTERPHIKHHYFSDTSTSYNQSEMFDIMAKDAFEKGYAWQLPVDADEILVIKSGQRIDEFLKQHDDNEHGHINIKWFDYHPVGREDNTDNNYFTRWKYRTIKNKGYTKIIYKWKPGNAHGYGHHAMIAEQNLICEMSQDIMFLGHFPNRRLKQIQKKAIRIGEAFIEKFGRDSKAPQIQAYKRWEKQGDQYFLDSWNRKCKGREKIENFIYDPIDERLFL